jgi:ATP phosphoribosyltransferase regulatory subunit
MAKKKAAGSAQKEILVADMGRPNSEPQWQFFLSRVKYTCYGGARGGGKSWCVQRKPAMGAYEYPGIRILILRREYGDMENSIITPLLKVLAIGTYSYNKTDHMITFTDADGRLLALKPDVTLSIVKNTKDGEGLRKLYYHENVYRTSGDGSGIRELMQVGLECIGDVDEYAVSEVLLLASISLATVGNAYVLALSDMRILSAVLDRTGLSPEGRAKALEYVKSKNAHGILALAASEGVDGTRLARLTALSAAPDEALTVLKDITGESAATEALIALARRLEAEGGRGSIRIDFSSVSDTKYYSGIVFQGFIEGVGAAVLSGGEYDNLMARMGRSSKAIGFAVYLDLLERLPDGEGEPDTDVLLIYGEEAPSARVLSLVNRLTAGGERVLAVKAVPEKVTYRRIVRFEEEA